MATKVGIQFIHDSEQAVMEEPLEVQGVPQPPLESACEDAIRVISLPPYEQLKVGTARYLAGNAKPAYSTSVRAKSAFNR